VPLGTYVLICNEEGLPDAPPVMTAMPGTSVLPYMAQLGQYGSEVTRKPWKREKREKEDAVDVR
jgi:hypothetical protein